MEQIHHITQAKPFFHSAPAPDANAIPEIPSQWLSSKLTKTCVILELMGSYVLTRSSSLIGVIHKHNRIFTNQTINIMTPRIVKNIQRIIGRQGNNLNKRKRNSKQYHKRCAKLSYNETITR
jgi:hypothetical protein